METLREGPEFRNWPGQVPRSRRPWRTIRAKPIGRISLTGQRNNPPALFELLAALV